MTIGKNTDTSAFDSTLMARSPYYDDFDPEKKFLKVLFRPGQNVQARELTTLQSILQNQIERVGDHIFENGSLVSGGEVSVFNGFFARIASDSALSTEDLNSLVGRKITTTDVSTDTLATVVSVLNTPTGSSDATALTADNEQVVFFTYNTAGTFTGSAFSTTADAAVDITFKSGSALAPSTGTITNLTSVERGIYYLDGYFCLNEPQTIAPYSITAAYREFNNPTVSVGFDVTKTIVDASDDASLNDPANGFNNFNAPGADRFRITPTLAQRALSGSEDSSALGISGGTSDYVELVRVDSGTVTKKVKFAEYGDLLRTLARRTYDESGNYTVNPFTLTIESHEDVFGTADPTKLGAVLSPGKAYVSGYEFETISPTKFVLNKARTTQKLGVQSLTLTESTFVDTNFYTLPTQSNADGSVNKTDIGHLTKGTILKIYNGDTPIGQCKFVNIRPSSRTTPENGNPFLRFHITGVEMGINPATNKRFSLFDTNNLTFMQSVNSEAEVFDILNASPAPSENTNLFRFSTATPGNDVNLQTNRKIYKLPNTFATESIDGETHRGHFTANKMFTGTSDDGELINITLPTGSGAVEFIDSSSVVVMITNAVATDDNPLQTNGRTLNMTLATSSDFEVAIDNTGTPSLKIQLDGGADRKFANQEFLVTVPLKYSLDPADKTIRKKTLVTETAAVSPLSDDNTIYVFNGRGVTEGGSDTSVADLFDVLTILDGGTDVTSKFKVDTGQRIDLYDFARLILADGETLSSEGAELTVTYRRFIHSQSDIGGPFTRQSYATITELDDYADSPKFIDPDTGETIRLFDTVDFRPIRTARNRFDFSSNETVSPYDFLEDRSEVSFTTFLPRADVVSLGEDRVLRLVEGEPSTSPVVPKVNQKDLELYRIFVDAFTVDDNAVNVRFIDSQRFTMQDIGDIEDTSFTDAEFIYKNALRSQAIASALGLFPGAEALDTGVYVDDLIGHGNADVTKTQHNISIDPVAAQVHLPFETSSRSGTIAATTKAQVYNTNYGRLASAEVTGTADYIANQSSRGATISPNPFGIVDYLGTIKLNPSFDRYWSETKAAKVVVNVSGENNAWKKAISAPTGVDGKRFGFGTQWKDWESLWFGRVVGDENDTDSVSTDPDNKKYVSTGKRASFVRRVLSEKIVRKVGDRLIDISVVPYMQAVTITGVVENVKPNATHYLYFDETLVGATVSGYSANASGTFDFNVTIPTDTFLTGEKVVRVSDGLTSGVISTATSSADSTFYALGNYQTIENGIDSIRPPIKRRDASNTETFLGAEYVDSLGGIGVNVFNSLDPLSQTFTVDANLFPDGLMLETVRLSFSDKPTTDDPTVSVQIRPVDDNGSPRRNYVVPLSEKTLTAGDVTTTDMTDFAFEAPVYLSPGQYALCVLTNDNGFALNTTINDDSGKLNNLFVPRNDGQRTVYSQTFLDLKLVRNLFRAADDCKVTFTPDVAFTTSNQYSAFYFANARNILSNSNIKATIVNDGEANITTQPNSTYRFVRQQSGAPTSTEIEFLSKQTVSPLIDESQCKLLGIRSFASTSVDTNAEENANDEKSTSVATYHSKIVSLGKNANNLNVKLSGIFPSNPLVKVFARVKGSNNQNIEEQNYVELETVAGGYNASGADEVVVNNFAASILLDAETPGQSELGTFSEYQFKICIPNNDTTDNDSPIITSIAAVPLGRKTRDEFFDTIMPVGAVIPYAGVSIPEGFLRCDGSQIQGQGFDELESAIGTAYNHSTDPAGVIRLPDLRSFFPIGARQTTEGFDDKILGQDEDGQPISQAGDVRVPRTRGSSGGSHRLQGHSHITPSRAPKNVRDGTVNGPDLQLASVNATDHYNNTGRGKFDNDTDLKFGNSRVKQFILDDTHSKTFHPDGITLGNISNGTTGDASGAELDLDLKEQMPPFVTMHYIIKT